MAASPNPEDEPQLVPRNPLQRPGPIPDIRLEGFLQERAPSLIERQATTSSSSSSSGTISCGPKDTTGPCERSESATNNTTIPIILGVILPLGVAFIVLIILHRRHVKKLRREDAEDRHKSLDFGLGEGGPTKGKGLKNSPQMTQLDDKGSIRRDRGLSMDMGITNPYLLPPELHRSRESLHSLSRVMNTGDDKYRATNFIPDDGSIRSPSSLRGHGDDSSSFTGSSRRRFDTDSSKTLLRNVQDDPKSSPPMPGKFSAADSSQNSSKPLAATQRNNNLLAPHSGDPTRESFVSTTSSVGAVAAFRASNDYLGAFIRGGGLNAMDHDTKGSTETMAPTTEFKIHPPVEDIAPIPPAKLSSDERSRHSPPPNTFQEPHRHQQQPSLSHTFGSTSNSVSREANLPELNFTEPEYQHQNSFMSHGSNDPMNSSHHFDDYYSPANDMDQSQQPQHPHDAYSQDHHQQVIPEFQQHLEHPQHETEDDYYDEEEEHLYDYEDVLGYDPRRLTMGMRPLPPDDPSENPEQRANRIRSFYKEYFDDSGKAANPAHQVPYYDGSEYYEEDHGQGYYDPQAAYSHGPPRRSDRHRATVSNGSYMSGPRAYSSASARFGPGPGPRRMAPKKKLPPPKALNVLPTPYKLKSDLILPVDFAPPNRARLQRSGTPDSLRGGMRPYSPTTRAHVPLVSSFDDLTFIPSPHALRKSGAFTALDFAAPPRLKAGDSASETGSIRSNRSGVSAMHLHNIRNGAYRISRIPKEVAGTKNEITESLRPQWDMTR